MADTLKKLKPLLISAFIILLFNFPDIYGYINPPEGQVYLGQVSYVDPWDINVYVSAIAWAQENGFEFQNAYTTSPHKSLILYPAYTFLGSLLPNMDPFKIFRAATIVGGFILLFVIFNIAKEIVGKEYAIWVLFFTPLAGGLGWMVFPGAIAPDLYTTPFTFISAFQRGHEAVALALYFSSLYLFFKSTAKKSAFLALISGLLTIILTFIYPYYLLSYYLITGAFSLTLYLKNKVNFFPYFLGVVFLTIFPGIIYSKYLMSGNSFENVFSPTALTPPHPILLVVGYGLLTPLLLWQISRLRSKKVNPALLFLNIWFLASLALTYSQISFGKYFLRGLFFPGLLLFLLNLKYFSLKLKVDKKHILKIISISLPISTLVILTVRLAISMNYLPRFNVWSYMEKGKYEAVEFLKTAPEEASGVLAKYPLANILPAHTQKRVYMGHYFQTPNAVGKLEGIERFYARKFSEEDAYEFLYKNNISYVVFESMGNSTYEFLEKVFSNNAIEVYGLKE